MVPSTAKSGVQAFTAHPKQEPPAVASFVQALMDRVHAARVVKQPVSGAGGEPVAPVAGATAPGTITGAPPIGGSTSTPSEHIIAGRPGLYKPTSGPYFDPDDIWTNWPGTVSVQLPRVYRPSKVGNVVQAVKDAEAAKKRIRAVGSGWSFSDATLPAPDAKTEGAAEGRPSVGGPAAPSGSGAGAPAPAVGGPGRAPPAAPIARDIKLPPAGVRGGGVPSGGRPELDDYLVDMTSLSANLHRTLPTILSSPTPAGLFFHVEAGITIGDLNLLLDHESPRMAVPTMGGASGQTLAGAIATGTHGGDFDRPPLADMVRAIYLVGAGGVEHWVEPSVGITTPASVQSVFPTIAMANIHYDDDMFHAVLLSAGCMGIIYSMIIQPVAQYGLFEVRTQTTWSALQTAAAPALAGVLDGTFTGLASRGSNRFAQIVVNPFPDKDGDHNCYVTNRQETGAPVRPYDFGMSSASGDISTIDPQFISDTIYNAYDHSDVNIDWNLTHFKDQMSDYSTIPALAVALTNFAADNGYGWLMAAVIDAVLQWGNPVGERWDLGYKIMGGGVWRAPIGAYSFEVGFDVPTGIQFMNTVLGLIKGLIDAKSYVAGYVLMRICGPSQALLAMERFSPTCMIEIAILSGTYGALDLMASLQTAAMSVGGLLHWGQVNDNLTADYVSRVYGSNLTKWKAARGKLSGALATFDNYFSARCGLSG